MSEGKEIAKLDLATVRLITATQIATSVSDIVKELVENALDAGSTIIRVKLENFGIDKIEVADNGSGISKEDLKVCALPHYTSKIRQHQDLDTLTTYGFRGEALAAISSVSKLKVITKTENDLVATSCDFDHQGNLVDTKPSANAQGTLIIASQLFYNVPVRKQYYSNPKTKKEELNKVEYLLLNFGLIHPQLHLSLHHNRSPVWQKSRASDLKANIHQMLGHSVCSQMEFVKEESDINLFLMVPKSTASIEECFRSKSDRCFTFVNERPIVSKAIEKLMKELYEPVSGKSTLYPTFIVSLRFSGTEVDVNLKPNKSEVLMEREVEVLELVRNRVHKIITADLSNHQDKGVEEIVNTCLVEQELEEVTMIPETPRAAVSQESETSAPFNQLEVIDDEDLFNGFCEPFSEHDASKSTGSSTASAALASTNCDPEESITIGSDAWSRGVVKDSSGRTVHPVEILRGGDHFAKRISEENPKSDAKRPRLVETEEALKIVGSPPRQLETVNGKVRRVPSDPFENYCKTMTSEFLSQNPTTTFTELTQQLNQSWRNLSSSDRQQYERKASDQQQKQHAAPPKHQREPSVIGGNSLDRFLCPHTPVIRATSLSREAPILKSVVVCVDFSTDMLHAYRGESISKSADKWSCVGKVEGHGWICSHGDELYAVNFQRLYEVILYSRMLCQHHLPSITRSDTLVLNERTLGNSRLWELLIGLSAEWESPSSRVINDPRVTANGLGIRLCTDPTGSTVSAQVFKTPVGIQAFGLEDVQQILKQVSYPDSSTENCRPPSAQQLLKLEAAQLAAERFTHPDDSEICELLQQWSEFDDNNCLHGEPVVRKLKNVY